MSKPAAPGPTPHKNELVRRMVIDTVDQNYATARWVYALRPLRPLALVRS